MKKTKIVCTIGPACDSPDMLDKLAKSGMNVARLNFSHGDHTSHLVNIKKINELNTHLEVPIAILIDLQGPDIRLGLFKEKTFLEDGKQVVLTTKELVSDAETISIDYKKFPQSVSKGSFVYIADGTIELKVKEIKGQDVICEVVVGGEVNSRKNVNIPGAVVDLPAISDKDANDARFGAENKVDFIGLSFVKTAKDIMELKELLEKNHSEADVIAKIECIQAVNNIDEIIKAADGIMVARGDLGVQVPIEEVPNIQKMIIKKCNQAGKPVIVATQMLESMTKNPRPTRAEVTDVSNAILDGADAVMLSGETANGKYPHRAIDMMNKIIRETEKTMNNLILENYNEPLSIEHAISRSVCQSAHDLHAAAIITCTKSGYTARTISKYRPKKPIIAVTPSLTETKHLNLSWGVYPLLIKNSLDTDDLIKDAVNAVKKTGLISEGDTVVITAGIPFKIPGLMNFMKVHIVE
ncbi:Pyruvate kinase [Candidatus Tiddalikarchaeum anstoanum]|nr:Pyruvate kinase [Candidatus Tiddalikarchaeum anstoanum]